MIQEIFQKIKDNAILQEERYWIFYDSGYSFCTDAKICFRNKLIPDLKEETNHERQKLNAQELFKKITIQGNGMIVQKPEINIVECENKPIKKTCPDCNGLKSMTFYSESGIEYDEDCKLCDEKGRIVYC